MKDDDDYFCLTILKKIIFSPSFDKYFNKYTLLKVKAKPKLRSEMRG